MSYKIQKIKKSFLKTKNRKLKKRFLRRRYINQINSMYQFKYNLLINFLCIHKLFLNRKIISQYFIEESLTNFSFQN